MIVFTVAFGESYVANLFARCLPSLMTKPPTIDEPLTLLVMTTEEFAETVRAEIAKHQSGCLSQFHEVYVFAPGFTGFPPASIAGALLREAVQQCESNRFAFAVPDLIYSSTTFQAAYDLHRLTGKVVAIFNGRVICAPESNDDLPSHFFAHANDHWRQNATESILEAPGTLRGHLAVKIPSLRGVFCSTPNPFLGTFEPHDILHFFPTLKSWDHAWRETLESENRLIVYPDLDRAMSVEPEETAPKIVGEKAFNKLAGSNRQAFKFSGKSYLFTARA